MCTTSSNTIYRQNRRICTASNTRSFFRPTITIARTSNGVAACLCCRSSRRGTVDKNIRAVVALGSGICPLAIGLRCTTCPGRGIVGT